MNDNEIQELWNQYKNLLLSTKRPNIENVIAKLEESDFRTAPASTQYHNSYKGGLLQHSLNVYNAMHDFAPMLEFFEIPEDTVIITSLLHDICKVDCYDVSTRNVKDENGQWTTVPYYVWNEKRPYGHGEKSVIMILQCGVALSELEIAMIRNHMGFTATGDDERRVAKLFRICPQSLIIHWADELATFGKEGYDMPNRFIDKYKGRNITESLKILKEQTVVADKTLPDIITILGQEYKVAPQDSIVDDEKIIEVSYQGGKIKVYSPFGDRIAFLI